MRIEQSTKGRGFTLIELLIVVAIIAILAAIAVPNFLEAQTRAKIARVKSDMRTLVTALEAYHVDNNAYPREHREPGVYGDPLIDGQPCFAVPYYHLSTPIAYLSTAWLPDVFSNQDGVAPFDGCKPWIRYYDLVTRPTTNIRDWYGNYRLLSYGPNRDFFNNDGSGPNLSAMLYDPTNGTVSNGNIWRSPKNDGIQPPVGPPLNLLPPH